MFLQPVVFQPAESRICLRGQSIFSPSDQPDLTEPPGAYGTCKNGCLYCYATNGRGTVGAYDPESEILCRGLRDEDRISDRKMKTLK